MLREKEEQLREQEEQLEVKEKQLGMKEEQLREQEEQLGEKQGRLHGKEEQLISSTPTSESRQVRKIQTTPHLKKLFVSCGFVFVDFRFADQFFCGLETSTSTQIMLIFPYKFSKYPNNALIKICTK